MSKKNKIIITIIIVFLIGTGAFLYFRNKSFVPSNDENNVYTVNRTSQESANTSEETQEQIPYTSSTEVKQGITEPKTPIEEQIATFTTKIYATNDSARQNNISITCNTLNETIVKNGTTFSFCNTVRTSF